MDDNTYKCQRKLCIQAVDSIKKKAALLEVKG